MIWDKINGSLSKEIDMNGNDDSTAKVKKNISALRLYRIQQKENNPPPYQGPPKKYMGGEYDEGFVDKYSEIETPSGLIKGRALDVLYRGLGAGGKQVYETAEPIVGKALEMDYWKDAYSSTIGAPVDLANSLLSLLGIQMSSKPYLGSKYIREEFFRD